MSISKKFREQIRRDGGEIPGALLNILETAEAALEYYRESTGEEIDWDVIISEFVGDIKEELQKIEKYLAV